MDCDSWDVMCANDEYLEGNTSQSKCLEIPLVSLNGAQDETFFTGADVVEPVAVERPHAEGGEASY